jgi:succinyl-CoA synthetase beta subunit
VFMASPEGGVDIEEVAEKTPEKIFRVTVHPAAGLQPYQARLLAFGLGLKKEQLGAFTKIAQGLYRMFEATDTSLIEINPLIITPEGEIKALDGKVNIDDNALYRQKRIAEWRDTSQEDPAEVEASEHDLNYVALDGNIGCMVNGAGLAMGTMDLVKLKGGSPANFLDVGGGATKETVAEAFKIILSDANVKAVLINIFGGIVSCATIANGIIGAVEEVGVRVPVVVRFEGNNAKTGSQILSESGLNIIAATSLADAAEKVVQAAEGAA